MKKRKIRYATKSPFKREEIKLVLNTPVRCPGQVVDVPAAEVFDVEFFDDSTREPLERDLETMVKHKVKSAYMQIMAPCVVEHAGLILEKYRDQNYPGGLTQPMWDALGPEGFLQSALWAGLKATARAVVGYCDGQSIYTFVGETSGELAMSPRGEREFYWDIIFCPEGGGGLTYAEIVKTKGLAEKVRLSQSCKAMSKLFLHLLNNENIMFSD